MVRDSLFLAAPVLVAAQGIFSLPVGSLVLAFVIQCPDPANCTGSVESQPLDHQGSPRESLCLAKKWLFLEYYMFTRLTFYITKRGYSRICSQNRIYYLKVTHHQREDVQAWGLHHCLWGYLCLLNEMILFDLTCFVNSFWKSI